MTKPWPDAFVILTGGRGSRLGGMDKAALTLGGTTLLDRALSICQASPVVIVGPDPFTGEQQARARPRELAIVQEDPPHGGPAAGLATGIAALLDQPLPRGSAELHDALIAVWAVDQAGVALDTWHRLVAAAHGDATPRGAVLSRDGRRQYGVGVFPLADLTRACAARDSWHGASLRGLLDPLIKAEVPASTTEARDIDTLDDLDWWRRRCAQPRGTVAGHDPDPSMREGTVDDDADR